MSKHLALLGLTVPLGLVGYHLLYGVPGGEGRAEAATRVLSRSGFSLGGGYELSDLAILQQDLLRVEQRYVEKERLDPAVMFQAALDLVERQNNEVMFVREPEGERLQVSVGAWSTVLLIDPLQDFDDLIRQLRRVAAVLDEHLSESVERPMIEYAMINGALSTLDPHTILLPPRAAEEMDVENQGEFGGLGVQIISRDGHLIVEQPIPGTPAARVGLQADDDIIRIEDESTINMDLKEAVSRLRGEVGTPVTILVKRKQLVRPKSFTIVRAVIRVNPVEGTLLDGDIGYIRIPAFHRGVTSQVGDLLARFHRESAGQLRGLVIDLRSNPGGFLDQAVSISDRFLSEGVIVTTVEANNSERDEQRASASGTEDDYPIAVLVNGSSASASEIVAGALRNQERAIIIGERTFGKGSVQHLYTNQDKSKLKITVAKYLTPGDFSIQSVGIPPDIKLESSVIRGPRPGAEDDTDLVSLYWREWLDREVDLDHHLEDAPPGGGRPSYSLRFLQPEASDGASGSDEDPHKDWQVGLARQVLLGSHGLRRPEILRSAAEVLAGVRDAELDAIREAFAGLGIDWTEGQNPPSPSIELRLDLGPDDALVPGEPEDVAIEVTNLGEEPLFQLSAVSFSENPWLDHREFYFGRIDPGQTRRYAQRVELPVGYTEELAPVRLQFRDPGHSDLLERERLVRTEHRARAQLSYSLALYDDGSGTSRGDGDGLPEAGELIDLEITVSNDGEGPTLEAFARVKNKSGHALDLSKGSLELGLPRVDGGAACDPDAPGDGPCLRQLLPGESYTGRVGFELREPGPDGTWELELNVGDNQGYDYTTVQRGGFYDYFQLTETLTLRADTPLDGRERRAPIIELSRAPDLQAADVDGVVSGIVHAPEGIRDVMIFHGTDKIFQRGGGGSATAMPFSVETRLQPGLNTLFVLARDQRGLSATRAVNTLVVAPPDTP